MREFRERICRKLSWDGAEKKYAVALLEPHEKICDVGRLDVADLRTQFIPLMFRYQICDSVFLPFKPIHIQKFTVG